MKVDKQNKSILIISSSFAPSGDVGAKRFTFLSEIIKKEYPNLHILTRKEKYAKRIDDLQVDGGIIHRTNMWPPYPIATNNFFKRIINRLWVNYFCIVEPYSGWILPALIKGSKIIVDDKVALIIATCPLYSSMVVGYILSAITGAKLILDYRDPWSIWSKPGLVFGNKFRISINCFFEKKAVSQASALVFCSKVLKEDFVARYGKYFNGSYHIITNGFHDRGKITPRILDADRKNMVYAGSLYGERKIKVLVKPFLKLLQEGSITKDNFCLHIFGNLKDGDRKLIKEYDLHDMIRIHPPVRYSEILCYLKGANLLLLISGSDVRYALPFKFFDYISVKKPILAIAIDNSEVQYMMNKVDCGKFALINEEEAILSKLRTMLNEQNNYTFAGANEYTWEKIGIKYTRVIEEVLSKG